MEWLAQAVGHEDRKIPLRNYCSGLLLDGERKSVEPMAARLAPDHVQRMHESLHHFVAQSPWSDADMLRQVRSCVLPAMQKIGPVTALVVDETGVVKKGSHSVGVARQYCGRVGKKENCQVAVSLSVATASASLPIAWRLYLPEEWANDPKRRQQADVPKEVEFQTKPQIALAQIRQAVEDGVPPGVVLADEVYGSNREFRSGVAELPESTWQEVAWRKGSKETLRSRFAALQVRPAYGDDRKGDVQPEQWLLMEWPNQAIEPTGYWLARLPVKISLKRLVGISKHRWVIERDYEELKSELGLAQYEGRNWRGFHHHATLCIAAYGFLMAERSRFSPSAHVGHLELRATKLPPHFQPRGAKSSRSTA